MPHLDHIAAGSFESLFSTLILALMVIAYLWGWLSVRAAKVTSAWRRLSFVVGLFFIWIAVASPIAALDHELLIVHMVQHLLLMTIAPPLIWLGAPAGNMLEGMRRPHEENLHTKSLRSNRVRRFLRVLQRPEYAWLAACVTLVGWHIPQVFALGMQSSAWHLFEQLSFLAAGLLFWWPLVRPTDDASRHSLSMILYLFFATLPCDILSGILAFSDRVAYPMYLSSSHLLGFSALEDQQCAAALMWTCVTLVYLLAGAILTMHILSPNPCLKPAPTKLSKVSIGRRVSESQEAF